MFRIKICGVTRPEDAAAAAAAGADAIGLNFYAGSSRCIDDERAMAIIAALPTGIAKVGVFVNAEPACIRDKAARLGLDWIQLHGDEPADIIDQLSGLRVIRAIRLQGDMRDAPDRRYFSSAQAVLIDAYSPAAYGGTGTTVDWAAMHETTRLYAGSPIILAGGLTPENIGEAIGIARPDAVDTASGVESSPGIKDHVRIKDFVAAARQAFAILRRRTSSS